MNQNITYEEHLEELLMSLKFMDVIPSVSSPAFSEMLELLARHIDDLITSNFNMLLALLYRIDVDETRVKNELKNADKEETAGYIIARLIIARQNEKLEWRRKFSNNKIYVLNAKVAIKKGIHYKTKKPISLVIHDGKITSIVDDYENTEQNRIIAPGLVDIQINGYKGYDFNISGSDEGAWKKVIEELISVGVTTFYPTLITNSYNHLKSLFKAYSEILVSNPVIGGFHLEGPYISPQDGPRGAHSKKHVRRPDWEEFCRLQEAASGMIKIITISPEYPEQCFLPKKP